MIPIIPIAGSTQDFRIPAAVIPSTNPRNNQIIAAPKTSERVAGIA